MSVQMPINKLRRLPDPRPAASPNLDAGPSAGAGAPYAVVKRQQISQDCMAIHTKGRTIITTLDKATSSTEKPGDGHNHGNHISMRIVFQRGRTALGPRHNLELEKLSQSLGPVTAKAIEIRTPLNRDGVSEADRRVAAARAELIAEFLAMRGIDAVTWHMPATIRDNASAVTSDADEADLCIEL